MGKKGKAWIGRERLNLYRVHYECVRRNPEYAEAYQELKNDPRGSDFRSQALAVDWGILPKDPLPHPHKRPPLDQALSRAISKVRELPHLPSEFWISPQQQKPMQLFDIGLTDMKLDPKAMAGMLVLTYFREQAPRRHAVTAFDIRWSKKDIMESFETWLNSTLEERATAGLKQERPRTRLRLSEYPDYLRVYDLQTERRSFKEIGEIMWKRHRGDLARKAKEYYKKGQTIVSSPPLAPMRERR
ncbi:MAG: hypothetical protein ACE1Z6_05760 [Candidatus Methylomirabilales bacterium]